MEITKKTFCTNIKNISDGLRTSYICEKTGRVCSKLDYSSGKPLPSKLFMKNGCPLMKEENEQIVEEVKEEVIEAPVVEAPVVEAVDATEEIAESIVATVEEEKKVTQQNKPRTNNYKKKKSNNKK